MIHYEVVFENDGARAQRVVQVDGDQTAAEMQARVDWPEFADFPVVLAYALAEVDENGCHATDGQRLLTATELRAALDREARTL